MRLHLVIVAVFPILLSSCEKKYEEKNTFTLSSGVSIAEIATCSDVPSRKFSVIKSASDYLVTTTGNFSCQTEAMKPYLTIPIDKKATLVIQSESSKSSCECFRSVTIKLSGRLDSGDLLYVSNSGEVIGHAELR